MVRQEGELQLPKPACWELYFPEVEYDGKDRRWASLIISSLNFSHHVSLSNETCFDNFKRSCSSFSTDFCVAMPCCCIKKHFKSSF